MEGGDEGTSWVGGTACRGDGGRRARPGGMTGVGGTGLEG